MGECRKKEAIVVIGTREKNHELQIVKTLGLPIILLNTTVDLEDALEVEYPIEINLNDEESVIQKLEELSTFYELKLIFTLNEYRIITAAKISQELNVPFNLSYQAAVNCRQKKNTRKILNEFGIGNVKMNLVQEVGQLPDVLESIVFPVIVKPSNEAGSHLVQKCHTEEELYEAVRKIKERSTNWVGQQLDDDILIEEFIVGPEFSVESCTINGETRIIAITEKIVTDDNFFVEVGHVVPARLATEDELQIRNMIPLVLQALGVTDGITHTEVKVTTEGPKVIEVNARPGGDRIPNLVRAVTGYDLFELAFHISCGGSIDHLPRHDIVAHSAGIQFILAEKEGRFRVSKATLESSEVEEYHLQVDPDEEVFTTDSNYNRLGYFICYGDEREHAVQRLKNVYEQSNIMVF
ncbi:ATP-grasp domain-containing protein [Bacillus alkalicellulosilyticus]|uniref:ATP-grasp domain-containing protein n=1 Tax=Alkalihalobacterium alkalicellulosilyticum TaxID=1912214 RepID=UPI0009970761|nr:ATP-grasp domain-containing protein [Bacillus alkalicellulosilyticus]